MFVWVYVCVYVCVSESLFVCVSEFSKIEGFVKIFQSEKFLHENLLMREYQKYRQIPEYPAGGSANRVSASLSTKMLEPSQQLTVLLFETKMITRKQK